jgi:hypothetical protein
MYRNLISLEFKSFFRNPQLSANIAMKILMGFSVLYFSLMLIGAAFGLFFIAKEELNVDPLVLFCKYFMYYWVVDLMIRYMMQQMPTQNIKPFLTQNITKKKLVSYTIIKTLVHFFNWAILLFLIPFSILLLVDGNSPIGVISFFIGIVSVIFFNNFLNILLNGKTIYVVLVGATVAGLAALEYFQIFSISTYAQPIFYSFYNTIGAFLLPILLLLGTMYLAYKNIYDNFYLDKGLELKKAEGKTENIEFLNKFGVIGTFLNNDIRLLKRSKAAKSAVFGSFAFLFYGLLFFNGAYQTDFMKFFAAIFVTGGFVFMFGQKVPAWDSSYYPLMMTQNVPYKKYLQAKWSLVAVATLVCLVLATAYILIDPEIYYFIFAGGLYNLGVNSYLTLFGGAYNKQPIDLNSKAKSFSGGKNNFNFKVLLLMIPQMVFPMAVFAIVKYFFNIEIAVAAIGLLGLIGFLLKDKIFDLIVKRYKTEKYSTLEAFKKAE